MGTQTESFVELTERIGRKTGGLSISPFTSAVRGQQAPVAKLMLSLKTMADKVWRVHGVERAKITPAAVSRSSVPRRFMPIYVLTRYNMR